MLNKIKKFCTAHGFNPDGQTVGVAISGGPDSVALLMACRQLDWNLHALHCNFHLRGEESDLDERYVTDLCAAHDIPLEKIGFDVAEQMARTKESVEMACRSLRYQWFEETAGRLRLYAVVVGHNLNDNIETVMLNMMRGSGLAGLKGIPARRGIYFRPMLEITRSEIIGFLDAAGIAYRTDSSNSSTQFRRNYLRNKVLPLLYSEFPAAESSLKNTISYLNDDYRLFASLIDQKRSKYVSQDGSVDLASLIAEEPDAEALLFHILDRRMERPRITKLIAHAGESGKYYRIDDSATYLLDRGKLIPVAAAVEEAGAATADVSFVIPHISQERQVVAEFDGFKITARLLPGGQFAPGRDASFAWFDASILDVELPFRLSHPRTGDRMVPFSKSRSKLLSDIFTDMKIPLNRKSSLVTMSLGDDIVWIPGVKTSALYPVTPLSCNIIEFHFENSENFS